MLLVNKQKRFKAIDQAIESIKQAEDVERILPLLRTNLMDDDVRCTYLSAKALQDLIKIDRYLPSLIKHQQFWQGRTNKLRLRNPSLKFSKIFDFRI